MGLDPGLSSFVRNAPNTRLFNGAVLNVPLLALMSSRGDADSVPFSVWDSNMVLTLEQLVLFSTHLEFLNENSLFYPKP